MVRTNTKRVLSRSLAFAFLVASVRLMAQPNGHWKKIGQLPLDSHGQSFVANCGYFWSPDRGMVYASAQRWFGSSDTAFVFYTTNGGATWGRSNPINRTSPVNGGLGWCSTSRILMVDSLHGWASCAYSSLHYTADGGKNWQPTDKSGWNEIYLDLKDSVQVANLIKYNLKTVSKLSDSIWVAVGGINLTPPSGIYLTTDAGDTWNENMPNFPDTWGLYASHPWNKILLWSETDVTQHPMISS